jgi:hypothetical protein
MLCNDSANGHKILKEVFFLDTGRWYLHVAGKQVDPHLLCFEKHDRFSFCDWINKNKFLSAFGSTSSKKFSNFYCPFHSSEVDLDL